MGQKNVDTAKLTGCHKSTVTRVLAAHATGKVTKKRPGRTPILDTPKRKVLKIAVVQSRCQNLAEITNNFTTAIGLQVSERTIRRDCELEQYNPEEYLPKLDVPRRKILHSERMERVSRRAE